MITYILYKLISDLPSMIGIALGCSGAATIILCICLFAKGYRPTKQGLYNAVDRLEKEKTEKREKDRAYREYFRAHKPYPWSVWKD